MRPRLRIDIGSQVLCKILMTACGGEAKSSSESNKMNSKAISYLIKECDDVINIAHVSINWQRTLVGYFDLLCVGERRIWGIPISVLAFTNPKVDVGGCRELVVRPFSPMQGWG